MDKTDRTQGPGTTPKAAGRAGVRETRRRDKSKGVPEGLWILGDSVEWGGGWDRKLRDSPCPDTKATTRAGLSFLSFPLPRQGAEACHTGGASPALQPPPASLPLARLA